MGPNKINELADEFNRLQEYRAAETAGLRNQKEEIQTQINNINEKYTDRLNEIEADLMHILYLARYNQTEVHMHFMLKEAAEDNYELPDHYLNGYYEGMKEAFSLFLPKEKIEEIDQNAQAKYPKLLL